MRRSGRNLQVEIAAMRRFVDGLLDIQLSTGAPARANRRSRLSARRMLRIAKLDGVVEILELAPVPNLHGAEISVLVLPDPDAFGVVAVGSEGRCAGGADPLAAALVAASLLLEALFQRLDELVPAQSLDLALFLLGEIALRQLAQPFLGDLGRLSACAVLSTPWKTWPNTRSNLSRLRSSFTRQVRDR